MTGKLACALDVMSLDTGVTAKCAVPCRAVPPTARPCYPLSAELNPVCHLLALLGAHHILHVSRKRVKLRLFSKSQKIYNEI